MHDWTLPLIRLARERRRLDKRIELVDCVAKAIGDGMEGVVVWCATRDHGEAFIALYRERWPDLAEPIMRIGSPVPCEQCGEPVEDARKVYEHPTCYACLPPPEPLPTIPSAPAPDFVHPSHLPEGASDEEI